MSIELLGLGMTQMQDHWNNVYRSKAHTQLGWYEETPKKCLELFDKCKLSKEDTIIDIGCGTSSFIDNLLNRGHSSLIGIDISDSALETLKQHLGERAASVKWIIDDIAKPTEVQKIRDIALWHDRAVLHFLLEEEAQQGYLQTLKTILRKNGHAIIAAFNLSGARKCSGLNIKNYDEDSLAEFLGQDFALKDSWDYVYQTPWGSTRPYVYTLFQRIR
ncbi:MAG: class I SAM-dependent methyltransferase [Candidatus Hodarchaeales archaeon]|jgi:cyclopropane fatty-acyl-phospholipid synthase-like methyltransferase